MSLVLPVPTVTFGPAWASQLNTALELVDSHDHTASNGVPIPTAGLNINADLSLNSYELIDTKALALDSQVASLADPNRVYIINGDLWFNNGAATPVQLTNGGSLAGVFGSITNLGLGGSSAIYSNFNKDFSFFFSASNPAALNIGDIRLYPFDGVATYSNAVTLKTPTALAGSYSMTLPLSLPLLDGVLSSTAAGVIKHGLGDGTAANPSLAFASDTNTGMYRIGADNIGVAANGTKILDVAATGLGVTGTLSASGTINGATIGATTFNGATISATAFNGAAVVSGAITAASLSTGGGVISGGAITGSSLTATGPASAITIETSGGGALKFKRFTGSLSVGGSATVDAGVGAVICGFSGYAGASGTYYIINDTSDNIHTEPVNDPRYVTIKNYSGVGPLTYYITIIYQ